MLIQRITKGTLRSTKAWTHGRHATDDKHVKLDHQPAVALITRQKVQQEACFSNLAIAREPILVTPKRCQDAMELKERLTARPLKVAEYKHQFKNESQGTERNRDQGGVAK